MHRIDHSTANATLPAPDAAGAAGYFKKGDPQTGVPATVVTADFANAVQEELAYVITQAGLALSKADNTQLRAAILKTIQDAGKAVVIQNATFEASVANGEAVRWDAGNNRFDEAIADGSANNQAVGFADVTNSKVYCYGETPALFAGLTPSARYYLDGTTPGAITAVAPADKIPVGIAKSATTLFVDIDPQGGGLDINGLTEDTAPDAAADYVPTYDASAAANKKVKLQEIFSLQAWQTKSSDTVYQASTDGFVVAHGFGANKHGYTDSSNPPTIERARDVADYVISVGMLSFPVRKNDYWKVTDCGSFVYFLPFTT